MIGALSPIVVSPAPRALVVRTAARPVAVSGEQMLFIPVAMPDGVIVVRDAHEAACGAGKGARSC